MRSDSDMYQENLIYVCKYHYPRTTKVTLVVLPQSESDYIGLSILGDCPVLGVGSSLSYHSRSQQGGLGGLDHPVSEGI